MRILNITEWDKSSNWVLDNIIENAGIPERSVEDIKSVQLEHALQQGEADLIVIEAHRTLDLADRIIQQAQAISPETPIFVIFHSEASPSAGAERDRQIVQSRLRNIAGFVDANEDTNYAATRLLEAMGIHPEFDVKNPEKANVRVGDILFNVLERKAYSITKPSPESDQHSDSWISVSDIIHNITGNFKFAQSGSKLRIASAFATSSDQTELFELTVEEAKFIEILAWDQGEAVKRSTITQRMYDGVFQPELHRIDSIFYGLRDKITAHGRNADDFTAYLSEKDGYALNDHAMSLSDNPVVDIDPEEDYTY